MSARKITSTHWRTILALDFCLHATATYAANFPGVDVRCAKVEDCIATLPAADVIIGGPPCQAFSLAGKGLGEADPRNGWPAYVASVRKVMPRMFLAENVAGMLTPRHLKYLSKVYAELEACGYVVEWRRLDSVNFGVPQFRDRIWIWGIRRDLWKSVNQWPGIRHQWPAPTHAWPPPVPGMFGGELLPGVTVGQALHIWYPGCGWDEDAHQVTGIRRIRRSGVERRDHPLNEPCPSVMAPTGGKSGLCKVSYADVEMREVRQEISDGQHPKSHTDRESARDETALSRLCSAEVPQYDHGLADPAAPCPTIKAGGNIDASGHQGGACPPAIPYRWSDAMLRKHPPASPASPASAVQAKYYKGGAEGLLEITDNAKHQPHQPANTLNSGGNGHGMNAANMALTTKGDYCEVLQNMRKCLGDEAFEKWGISLSSGNLLQQNLHGEGLYGEKKRVVERGVPCGSPPLGSLANVRQMWDSDGSGHSSQKPQLPRQLFEQLGMFVQAMSREGPSKKAAVQSLWEASKGIPVLQQTLEAIQGSWRPNDRREKKSQTLYCRRLTPWECLRLMSGPDSFRWPEKISKTAMYRIIGNGQCSLMSWHMSRALAATDPASRTVISLFCGGGVGDVGFHGRAWRYEP